MLQYLPLVQKLLLDHITRDEKRHKFAFNFTGLVLMLLSGIIAFLIVIFLFLALESYLEISYGEPLAWLLTAAAAFIVTSILYLCACYSKRRNGLIRKIKEEIREEVSPLSEFIEDVSAPIKDHPLMSVLIAVTAGLLAGDKINDKENN